MKEQQRVTNGPVYRSLAVRELYQASSDVFSERKQMWMRLIASTLPLLVIVFMLMPQWKYYVMGISLPIVLLLFWIWDFWFNIRHIKNYKKLQSKIVLVDDEIERAYVISRPDVSDYAAPYIIYILCFIVIISIDALTQSYNRLYSDGKILTINQQSIEVRGVTDKTALSGKK